MVDGEPLITHAPLIIHSHEPLVLAGHVARANPHAHVLDGARVLAIFTGPDAYVSPRWTSERANNVPTWNYATAHCSGIARVVEGDEKFALMRKLVDKMEAGAAGAWSVDELAQPQLDALLAGIVAFTIAVDRLVAKYKLSQNSSRTDRSAIIDALNASGNPREAALAEAMRLEPERPS